MLSQWVALRYGCCVDGVDTEKKQKQKILSLEILHSWGVDGVWGGSQPVNKINSGNMNYIS